jgi:DNA polymerase
MLVGEQPGDQEDRAGQPFVGPAGRVLAEGLERAGLPREEVYITNVVKHFRYKLRGKRRIHQRPDRWQVSSCLPWLEAELSIVAPEVLVCLGATAGQALLGPSLRVGRDHGQPLDSQLAPRVTVTAHPSSILRVRTSEERDEAMATLVDDLKIVAGWLRA